MNIVKNTKNLPDSKVIATYLNGMIFEYNEDIFVVFDPTTDGAYIAGAYRTLEEAIKSYDNCTK